MSLTKPYVISLLLVAAAACQDELHIDYQTVPKMHVVEGHLTNKWTWVQVSETRNVDDGTRSRGLEGATVTITDELGNTDSLYYVRESGRYQPLLPLHPTPGIEYTLKVVIDGREYAAKSTMQGTPEIVEAGFVWFGILSYRILFYEFTINDLPGKDSRYWYRMIRNSVSYKWDLFTDIGFEDAQIVKDQACMGDHELEEPDEDTLCEGDSISLEVYAVDRAAFEYLTILGRSGVNPPTNFEGGCLGYFAAHSVAQRSTIVRFDSIPDFAF